MTRLINRDGHTAVHGLALRSGCACPDCGRGPRRPARFEAFDADDVGSRGFDEDAFLGDLFGESDADAAARRRPARSAARPPAARTSPSRLPAAVGPARRPRRPGGRPRQPLPRHPPQTARRQAATRAWLSAQGWTQWRQGAGGAPVSVQDLVNFAAAGGVRQLPGAVARRPTQERLRLTPQGQRLLQNDPRFRRLAPMFRTGGGGDQLYHITEPGGAPDHRSHYIGKTRKPTGIRVLEHLRFPEPGRVHTELVDAARNRTLNQLQVQRGQVTAPDLGGLTHGAEVLLQHQHRSDWNDPRGHGFDEAVIHLSD